MLSKEKRRWHGLETNPVPSINAKIEKLIGEKDKECYKNIVPVTEKTIRLIMLSIK